VNALSSAATPSHLMEIRPIIGSHLSGDDDIAESQDIADNQMIHARWFVPVEAKVPTSMRLALGLN
jgi:hypothetical protein